MSPAQGGSAYLDWLVALWDKLIWQCGSLHYGRLAILGKTIEDFFDLNNIPEVEICTTVNHLQIISGCSRNSCHAS